MVVHSKKGGFQLSTNMIVVLILGVVILGVGFGIFSQISTKLIDIKDSVDAKSQAQLNALLDNGELIAIPFYAKEGKRGSYVDFDIAINNELYDQAFFRMIITYEGTTAQTDAFKVSETNLGGAFKSTLHEYYSGNPNLGIRGLCKETTGIEKTYENCGHLWVLLAPNSDRFFLERNQRQYIPIRIQIPKKNVPSGQYIFNLDVLVGVPGILVGNEATGQLLCDLDATKENPLKCYNAKSGDDGETIQNRFASRQKLYVNIK